MEDKAWTAINIAAASGLAAFAVAEGFRGDWFHSAMNGMLSLVMVALMYGESLHKRRRAELEALRDAFDRAIQEHRHGG